jgi:hypothetical protein
MSLFLLWLPLIYAFPKSTLGKAATRMVTPHRVSCHFLPFLTRAFFFNVHPRKTATHLKSMQIQRFVSIVALATVLSMSLVRSNASSRSKGPNEHKSKNPTAPSKRPNAFIPRQRKAPSWSKGPNPKSKSAKSKSDKSKNPNAPSKRPNAFIPKQTKVPVELRPLAPTSSPTECECVCPSSPTPFPVEFRLTNTPSSRPVDSTDTPADTPAPVELRLTNTPESPSTRVPTSPTDAPVIAPTPGNPSTTPAPAELRRTNTPESPPTRVPTSSTDAPVIAPTPGNPPTTTIAPVSETSSAVVTSPCHAGVLGMVALAVGVAMWLDIY